MANSSDFRHVPTGGIAVFAQRLGRVFASASTWHRLVRKRGWHRPRLRIYPDGPKVGIRTTSPNVIFHFDTTVIRLLDGTKASLHAVIDYFSRRILAWRVAGRFDPGNAISVLLEAGRGALSGSEPPMVMADSGVENVNGDVNALVDSGLFHCIFAMTEVSICTSVITSSGR